MTVFNIEPLVGLLRARLLPASKNSYGATTKEEDLEPYAVNVGKKR